MNAKGDAARQAIEVLKEAAENGEDGAWLDLSVLRLKMGFEWQDEIERNIKSGKVDSANIRDLLAMADFAIPWLRWLAQTQPGKLKPFARRRFMWPAYIARSAVIEDEYKKLLGDYNQAGELTKPGVLELGADLPFTLNRKTRAGILLHAAIRAIRRLEVENLDATVSYYLARFAPDVCCGDWEAGREAARQFLESLGKFTESNWPKWKPVLEHVLTVMYGPREARSRLLPRNSERADQLGHDGHLLRGLRRARPIHEMTQHREIKDICARRKSPQSQWSEIKNQILKRCESMATKGV